MPGPDDAAFMREQAQKLLRLANSIVEAEAAAELRNMALIYEIIAKRMDAAQDEVLRQEIEPPQS